MEVQTPVPARCPLVRPRKAVLLTLAAAVQPLLAGPAQDPSSVRRPVFPVELEAIHVTVTVLDRDGRVVSDLRQEDFRILEEERPQQLQVFGRAAGPGQEEALALDLGLLLDTSQSMLSELKLSQEAAVRFLDAIPRARELFTLFFDEEIRISRYDSENQQGLMQRIHEIKGGGNTALYDAIATYLSRVHGTSGRKTLVLFSDGEDSRSSLNLPELIEVVRSSAVTIYPIAFTGGFQAGSTRALRCRAFLQQMAELTGGQVYSPHRSRDLAGIYRKILDELGSQYVLGFVSSNPSRDGRFRKLKVEVARRGLKVRHRSGYYAPWG